MAVSVEAEPGRDAAAVLRRQRLADALFPAAEPRQVTRRAIVFALLALAVATVAALGRTRGAGTLKTIWAEDASIILTDALGEGFWTALTTPLNGYYIVVPRLLGEPAAVLPLKYASAVLALEAAGLAALIALLVFVASRAHVRDPVLRGIIAAPVVVAPVGALFTPHITVTLQFLAVYAMFWILLWVPATRTGRIVALVFAGLVGLSTILTIPLLPLAIARVVLRRGRHSIALLATMVGTLAVQVIGLATGASSRGDFSHPRPDPIWALAEYVLWGLPYSVLGQRWLEPPIEGQNGSYPTPVVEHTVEHAALVGLAWVVVLAALFVALRRITRPAWVLAAVAGAHSVMILCFEIMAMGYESDSYLVPDEKLMITDRYLVPAALLLVVVLVALLRPGGDLAQPVSAWPNNAWPVLVYAMLLLVVCVANYRPDNPRAHGPSWPYMVTKARAECAAPGAVTINVNVGYGKFGGGWPHVVVPCDRLR